MASPRVIPLSLGIARAYLVIDERPILVDAGPPRSERRLLRAIEAEGVNPDEIALLLLTHAHTDHFGGLPAVKARCGAPVAVQRLAAPALQRGVNESMRPVSALGHIFRLIASSSAHGPRVDADIIVNDELSLREFGVAGRAISTPGHTPGSLSVVLDNGEVIIGDLLMGSFIRRHRPMLPFFADDVAQLRRSLSRLLEMEPKRIYASHGREFDCQHIIEQLMLEATEGEG
ncbi:MAG TPA: MBL fold metallo-hydrolase [Chloroflexi bacterium]|jgi:hydroxyacylglutathione hydrolase|nr:MBL fold metallo-hydrolase [Chloroflexota bacterium]